MPRLHDGLRDPSFVVCRFSSTHAFALGIVGGLMDFTEQAFNTLSLVQFDDCRSFPYLYWLCRPGDPPGQ